MRIDFEKKHLVTEDAQRASPFETLQVAEATILMSGSEQGQGWVVVLDRATGHFTATITEQGGAFVLAGVCGKAP